MNVGNPTFRCSNSPLLEALGASDNVDLVFVGIRMMEVQPQLGTVSTRGTHACRTHPKIAFVFIAMFERHLHFRYTIRIRQGQNATRSLISKTLQNTRKIRDLHTSGDIRPLEHGMLGNDLAADVDMPFQVTCVFSRLADLAVRGANPFAITNHQGEICRSTCLHDRSGHEW